jgi:type VII secretion protein EccB
MLQTRKDLLQAHRLMTQRAALALMQGEPDPPDRPLRRLNVGVISSVLVAVIVAAIFGIWGLIDPGHAQGLTAPNTIIVDTQSGTPYIWCEKGKRLCPVVNYASARLALRTNSPNQHDVSQASLAKYPRGPLIGIPGLPQPLPDDTMLIGQPWSVCVQTLTNPATSSTSMVTTLVGGRSVGGRVQSRGNALLVSGEGNDWVIWSGERLGIPAGTLPGVLTALGTTRQPTSVPSAWLNSFHQGPAFARPGIAGFSGSVTGPAGPARVGQVFTTTAAGSASEFFVLLRDGKLAPITQTQAALLEASLGRATPVNPSQVAADRAPALPTGGLPQHAPTVVGYNTSEPLCVVYNGSSPAIGQVTVGGKMPSGALPVAGAGGLNRIALPPGTAALAGEVSGTSAGQAPDVTTYVLITGGRRYVLASPAVAGYLGYSLSQRTLVPAGVVDLIPLGPALDPSAANHPVPEP